MGSGSSKSAEAFQLTPAGGAVGVLDQPAADSAASAVPALSEQQLLGIAAALAEIPAGPEDPQDQAGSYETFAAAATAAREQLHGLTEQGGDPQILAGLHGDLKAATQGYLTGLTPAQLQEIAAHQGFPCPELVGLSRSSVHPLVHVLDPAYAADAPSKLKIAAVAEQRHQELLAGGTVGGLTLADLHPAPAAPAAPQGTWEASPSQVLAASARVTTATLACQGIPKGTFDGAQLAELVEAENQLATAWCPQLADGDLQAARAAASSQVDGVLAGLTSNLNSKGAAHPAIAAAVAAGALSAEQSSLLTPREALAVARVSTPDAERQQLLQTAGTRAGQLAALAELRAKVGGPHPPQATELTLPPLDTPGNQATLKTFTEAAGGLWTARAEVLAWGASVNGDTQLFASVGGLSPYLDGPDGSPATLTTHFKTWAKSQPLAQLRTAATSLGLTDSSAATRHHVQAYIASHWDPGAGTTHGVQAMVCQAAAKKSAAAAAGAAIATMSSSTSSSVPASAPTPAGQTGTQPGTTAGQHLSGSFASKHLEVLAALQHHQATAAALPGRVSAAQVAGWTFTVKAASAGLGGVHTKSLVSAPDGSTWLFKPDKTNAGARAHAEAAASQVFAAVGVPTVGVHVTTVGGASGSVQPLLPGTAHLATDTSTWSQADVDAIVRYHVAAWAVGDHDGKNDNMLRTSAGGLIPCDQGAAFKWLGRDKLATDYAPHAGGGYGQPVYQQAYQAAKGNSLAKGVRIRPEAALPVLQAFDAIPDSQYRGMLTDTARHGAKNKVAWVEPMRSNAAARLKIPPAQVTSDQIAEEFLDAAVDRKKGLRTAFSSFYAGLGMTTGAAKLTQL